MLEKLLVRPLLIFLLRLIFRVEVRGMEHYHAAGGRVLMIANHQSFLDPLIIAVFLPEKPAFAINVFQADKWYFRWLDKIITLYRLDPSKPMSMKRLIQDLRQGAQVVIFPEGRITTSGGIMKIYDGTGMIAQKTGTTLLPLRIDGAEFSKVSRLGRKLRQRWFPKVRLTVLPPRRVEPDEVITADMIYTLMTDAAFAASRWRRPLLSAVLEAYRFHGGAHPIACDIARADMGYRQLFTRAFVLSDKLKQLIGRQGGDNKKYIAVMLPNSLAALVTFVSLHILGKIPCMLNFSSGESNLLHACRIATATTVLTSRAFVEKAKLEHAVTALQKECLVIYLEDIRPGITLADKLKGVYHAMFAQETLQTVLDNTKPDDPAVILYTSGSEGAPKGVALSHANLLSNMEQVRAKLDLVPSDILFNAMPVFHSFGLTVGMIMPVVAGLKTFLYPSPLHYRIIPDLLYDTDATIMLGTDTFYNGYARYAHRYDFSQVRLAVAGAEKLKASTRELYMDTFMLPILEGYGVTEASPVISFNTPMQHKTGTVGQAFPGIECKLEKVEGLEQGGRLLVKGPNIMLGYLKADKPGYIQPQGQNGEHWYDTGDVVSIDEDGFITILGRAKRFAKIGGEMVSLVVVEDMASDIIPDAGHAAIAVPDERKGEQIILYTESKELTREQLLQHARQKGIAELCLPKHVTYMEALPRLGTGKIDYPTLSKKVT